MLLQQENSHNSRRLTYLVILFIIARMGAFCQETRISGTILDGVSGLPVSNATVYVNGSSTGTTTDDAGVFIFTEISVTCELIISHVSYRLMSMLLRDSSILDNLHFRLEPRIVMLEEVTVTHLEVRNDYLAQFKFWFLDQNYQKYKADILNDSILYFNATGINRFSVHANETILVHLPHTGYILKVDLVKFDLKYKEELSGYHCSILGYYYFEPIPGSSPRKQRILARNRVEHYYNSIKHFCKSLYHNGLAVNGYRFERDCNQDDLDSQGLDQEPNFTASYNPDQYGNQQLLLTNFACEKFRIMFYSNARNRPVDLTLHKAKPTRMEFIKTYFSE